jgi:phage regulator Rha-like protein
MTSREIADLTSKRHRDVLRDIDKLVESLSADLRLGFKPSTYKDSSGKENRQFDLDRDSSICLVSGYDANARMRIIKRWQELEAKAGTLPRSFADALQLAADQQRRIENQQAEIEAAHPKIAFHDQVVSSETLMDFAQAFSLLQRRTGQHFTRRTFLEFMRRHGIACQPNRHANIGKDRFVPRKDYTGTWFVSEMSPIGAVEWLMRPMALAGIVALIEQDRLTFPPPLSGKPPASVQPSGGAA